MIELLNGLLNYDLMAALECVAFGYIWFGFVLHCIEQEQRRPVLVKLPSGAHVPLEEYELRKRRLAALDEMVRMNQEDGFYDL